MGIYDRDYYRDDAPSAWDDWQASRATLGLVFLIATGFLAVVFADAPGRGVGRVVEALGFQGQAVQSGEVWRLVTSQFLHPRQSFFKVLWYCIAIVVVGMKLEPRLTTREFLAFVGVTVAAVAAAKLVFALASNNLAEYSVGSAGVVTALLALYVFYFPYERLFLVVAIPVAVVVLVFIGFDVVGELGPGGSKLTLVGHLAGGLAASGYYAAGVKLTSRRPRGTTLRLRTVEEKRPARTPEPPVAAPRVPEPSNEQIEAKVDAILDKVSRTGQDSLTDDERQTLRQASELFQRRRKSR